MPNTPDVGPTGGPPNHDPVAGIIHSIHGLPVPSRLLLAAAALEGGAGVALAALAAHAVRSPALSSAAGMLILHAGVVAGLALAAAWFSRRVGRMLCIAGVILAFGAGLFAGAVSASVLGGMKGGSGLAPVGGTLLILGWLSLLVPALFGGRRK